MHDENIPRTHKDRLFRFIFGQEAHKDWTLSLYNALNGSHYTDPEALTFNTLENALYLSMQNDVSFLLGCFVNIWEHQGSLNLNMPVRMLSYVSRVYDGHITANRLRVYDHKRIELPAPKLVVFYNGKADVKDEVILRLSDSFPKGISPEEADIEVRVRMVNINYGHNRELLEACRPLSEYAWLVAEIRNNQRAGLNIEAAVDKALSEMPKDALLRPFLMKNRAEVKNMLLTEYNEAETMEMIREAGYEEGREEGILGTVSVYRDEMGLDDAAIIDRITVKYNLTVQQAREYVNG